MVSRQELRSEETKRGILSAAGTLFAEKGFDTVTMREIAKKAGCSHTTIYLYFKDKETLLYQLSMPPLEKLKQKMSDLLLRTDLVPEEKLKGVSKEFIEFCLHNRNMYTVFFNTKASRVDEEKPELELNRLRIELFDLLKQALQGCLSIKEEERLLAFTRITFFTLHGIVGTYHLSDEPLDTLLDRMTPTFAEAMEVLLLGFKQKR
ncbi:TetR/AcrR family transcriptional regulator [Risungbinella massiliensis]|uniref:TetR/AcrR family transcriptional regulator n=1 Tax=Risungbinella massiliensis TaxID=1329796 RepID=UPI0005CC2FAC|nr:TetR/AcrR family transcriptional regulator [Risungbinella massiliensis]